jgi:hypothetical protein
MFFVAVQIVANVPASTATRALPTSCRDMTGVEPGWREPPEMRGKESSLWHGDIENLRSYLAEVIR